MANLKLKKLNKPLKGNVEKDIMWFCDSLCLSSGRDTGLTSNRIIQNILNKRAEKEPVSSENIAYDLNMTQGLVNHHLRNLIDSGILMRKSKQIFLKGGSLKQATREIKKETMIMFDELEDMAKEIDNELGIESR